MAWDPYPPKETNNMVLRYKPIVVVLETMRGACRNHRDVLRKQVDDCTLPLNRASIETTMAIDQRASMLNDLSIVLSDTINELKTALETETSIKDVKK